MKNIEYLIKKYLNKHRTLVLFYLSYTISIIALVYCYQHGNLNLSNYDAIARLNTSRKIIDSLTPGVGQLGGVWLPFPQVLMLPFIWNDFLWHSGLAGSFVSASAFIFGSVFLQKTALLITKSIKVSLLVWFLFVTNVNILLLQTMAMSEMFFLFCFIMVLYFLTKWVRDHDIGDFLSAAFFITIMTLTRYEGYFILIGSALTVLVECIRAYRNKGNAKIEGMVLLFLTVAGFGIFLWCIYCVLFYKDPLYWLHVYSSGANTASHAVASFAHISFVQSLSVYSQVILLTNGIITVMLAILGFTMVFYQILKGIITKEVKQLYIPIAIITMILFISLVYGYYRGFIPHIEFPPKLLAPALSRIFSLYADNNIRYGIIMAPAIFLLAGFTASRSKVLFYGVLLLVGLQLMVNMSQPLLLQYSFSQSWRYAIPPEVTWFRQHYDSGLILISANRHEDFMFETNLSYKNFIYEGTREYWTTSLDNPATYATWVIDNSSINEDSVHDFLTEDGRMILQRQFKLVYIDNGFSIYHK